MSENIFNSQFSTLNFQLSIFNSQFSAINYQEASLRLFEKHLSEHPEITNWRLPVCCQQ